MRIEPLRLYSTVFFAPLVAVLLSASAVAADKVTRYVRFEADDTVAYGLVEGDLVRKLDGDLFGKWKPTDKTFSLSSVKLLVPSRPTQVLALAGNYKSHLKDAVIPPKFQIPQAFFKSPSCLIADGESIVIPPGTAEVHYEAELVIVIGKRCKNVSEDEAADYILGVTCGNDVSARDWQKSDVQWWRAKGSDTFGPCGPMIVAGLNYDDLNLILRLNGEVKQEQSTRDLIHSVPKTVSFISQHITLNPGDLIYTGTPGETSAIKAGDKVEVELEGVGVLVNDVKNAE